MVPESEKEEKKLKSVRREAPAGYKWAPPDRKWAWAVLLGSTMVSLCNVIPNVVFGVIIDQQKIRMDTDTATITWAVSIRAFLSSLLGPFITILLSRISCRKTIIIGVLGGFASLVTSAYAHQVHVFMLTFGVLGGIFHSFMGIPLQVTLSRYFKKYYGVAVGFHSAGFALGRTVFTPVVQLLLEKYGIEGVFLIMGAVMLHGLVGACLFQPIKWHEVLAPLSEEELEKLKKKEKEMNFDGGNREKTETSVTYFCCKTSTIDFTVLKEIMFYFLIFHSMVKMTTVQYGVIFMFPLGVDIGLEAMEAAVLVSTRSITEIVGRLAGPVIITTLFKKRLMPIFVCGLFINSALLTILSFMGPNIGVYIVAGLFGLFFGAGMALSQVIVVHMMGVERLSSVIGIKSFILSFLVFGSGPLIGWIRDVTGTYRNCYRFLSILEFALAFVWIAGLAIKKYRSR